MDFVEGEISEDRIKAQRYYDGEVDLGYEDGRSKVVATKVRDTVRSVKPSLMRIFLSTAKPVEFVPRGPEDVAMAEQATEFMHHEFTRLNGYRVHERRLPRCAGQKARHREGILDDISRGRDLHIHRPVRR